MSPVAVTPAEFESAEGTGDWRVLYWGAHAFFAADSYAHGATFVADIAALVADTGHDPDVDLRVEGVAVTLITRSARALTDRDVALARRISAAAAAGGLHADPRRLQVVQVAVASVPSADIADFWTSALGYVRQGPSHLVDPLRRNPSVFLQDDFEPGRPRRGRMHVDVCVPSDSERARVAATVAAGGRIAARPDDGDWVTLADAENHGIDVLSVIRRHAVRAAIAAGEP